MTTPTLVNHKPKNPTWRIDDIDMELPPTTNIQPKNTYDIKVVGTES